MRYDKIIEAVFIERINRFTAVVDAGNGPEKAHVKNTGRCKELLISGCRVYLSVSDNSLRATKYDLIAVEKERNGKTPLLINIDSQAPNDAVAEWLPKSGLFSSAARIRREVTQGNSRFDFCIEDSGKTAFMEVKGVTLEFDGAAFFPDAPTQRGVKHINELIKCAELGFDTYILFVVQMKEIKSVSPNDKIHKEFGEALRKAAKNGVNIMAVDCVVTPDSLSIDKFIKIVL